MCLEDKGRLRQVTGQRIQTQRPPPPALANSQVPPSCRHAGHLCGRDVVSCALQGLHFALSHPLPPPVGSPRLRSQGVCSARDSNANCPCSSLTSSVSTNSSRVKQGGELGLTGPQPSCESGGGGSEHRCLSSRERGA